MRREEKLRRFVHAFGKEETDKRVLEFNQLKPCVRWAAIFLIVAIATCVYMGFWTFQEPKPQSFELWRAESHSSHFRGRESLQLRLYEADGSYYETADDVMQYAEIEEALAFLRPGMQMEVLIGLDGLRQIEADGEIILTQEQAAARTLIWRVLGWVFGLFFLLSGVITSLRAVALHIKKQKGWNF